MQLLFVDKFYLNCSRRLRSLNVSTIPKIKYSLDKVIRRGKDKVLDEDHTIVVYKIFCNKCHASYVGETKRSSNVRTGD